MQKLQPIFLLGAGRSGTKFLRSVFAESEEVAVVPYDVGYVWRYGNENYPSDELTKAMLTPKIKSYIRKTLPKLVSKASTSQARFLLEKSVPNTLRPEFLYEVFPEAKFIHLIRDGRAVTESAVRLWQAPPEKGYLLKKLRYFPWSNYRYAYWYLKNMLKGKISGRGQQVWGPRYAGIQEDVGRLPLVQVCARQWRRCVEVSQRQLAEIPAENVIQIRYEDMMEGDKCIQEIIDFIGLSDSKRILDFFRAHLKPFNKDKWRERISEKDLEILELEIGETLSLLDSVKNGKEREC